MRYIDKTDKQSETAFNAIVNPYVASGRYRYDDLTESDRINLRKIVADEQDWMCAYCMRKLSQATSDHVIPKYIDEARYGKALRHMGEGLYRKDFIYDKKYTPHAVGHYYPHSLAYGNFPTAHVRNVIRPKTMNSSDPPSSKIRRPTCPITKKGLSLSLPLTLSRPSLNQG